MRMVASPTFWGQKPTIDEILFVTYQNPDTMTQDLLAGNLDAAWGIPSAQFPKLEKTEGFTPISYNLLTWDYLALNCYEGQEPRATRCSRTWPSARRSTGPSTGRRSSTWPGPAAAQAGHHHHDAGLVGRPGLPLAAAGRRDVHLRPGQGASSCSTPPATRTPTATACARTRTASPSSCACGPAPESPESQKTGSLLTGWFRDLGLKIEYQVMDDGIYYDSIWAYEGNTYSPDFDMYLWNYDGYADPGDTLASFITAQIENWNEPCWSDMPSTTRWWTEANTTLDPEKRKELVWRAQQIFYEQSPEIAIGLSGQARGDQHGAVGRLDADVRRHRRRLLHQLRARQLPGPEAEGRRRRRREAGGAGGRR